MTDVAIHLFGYMRVGFLFGIGNGCFIGYTGVRYTSDNLKISPGQYRIVSYKMIARFGISLSCRSCDMESPWASIEACSPSIICSLYQLIQPQLIMHVNETSEQEFPGISTTSMLFDELPRRQDRQRTLAELAKLPSVAVYWNKVSQPNVIGVLYATFCRREATPAQVKQHPARRPVENLYVLRLQPLSSWL